MDANVENPDREFDVYVRQEITIELTKRRITAKTLEEAERIALADATTAQINDGETVDIHWRAVACAV